MYDFANLRWRRFKFCQNTYHLIFIVTQVATQIQVEIFELEKQERLYLEHTAANESKLDFSCQGSRADSQYLILTLR